MIQNEYITAISARLEYANNNYNNELGEGAWTMDGGSQQGATLYDVTHAHLIKCSSSERGFGCERSVYKR